MSNNVLSGKRKKEKKKKKTHTHMSEMMSLFEWYYIYNEKIVLY